MSGGQGAIVIVIAIVESAIALLPDRRQRKTLFLIRKYVLGQGPWPLHWFLTIKCRCIIGFWTENTCSTFSVDVVGAIRTYVVVRQWVGCQGNHV